MAAAVLEVPARDRRQSCCPHSLYGLATVSARSRQKDYCPDSMTRFGRIRLVDCPGNEIRQHSPLVENGPDPVVDKSKFTEDYLKAIMRKRHVPVKALILDQTVISGVGNWVADESLYHAKMHPEQYCNEFSDEEVKRLHESIRYVCQTAVGTTLLESAPDNADTPH